MCFAVRAVSLLLAPILLSDAFRVRPQKRKRKANQTDDADLSGPDGVVDAIYTWGAASPSKRVHLENPLSGDGCWEGLRIVNVNTDRWSGIWEVDIVPPGLSVAGYEHAEQAVAKVDQKGRVFNYDCKKNFNSVEKGKIEIHMQDPYVDRAGALPQPAQNITKMTLWPSYYYDQTEIADYIKPFGWKLVGTSKEREKVVHLLQHPSTLECIITFQGSSRIADWWDNLNIGDAPYCGIPQNVHQGFRSQLRWTIESNEYQSHIRPKLGKCKKVTAVGHSLGGALAYLFAACTNTAPTSGSGWTYDYKYIQWKKETPKRMLAIA